MSGATVYLRVNRVGEEICRLAREVTVADLHEATATLGFTGLMSPAIRRVSGRSTVGPAVTALCRAGDNLMMHRALRLAQAGDVLVVACQGEHSAAQWGDMAARYAMQKGLAGVIVQGCVRDADALAELAFPVWASAVWPIHADKGKPGAVNVPIACGGVIVRPGDLVAADGDGAIVIGREHAAGVVEGALARMRREDDTARGIAQGKHLWELTGSVKKYEALGMTEKDAAFDD
jgi:4-hydroxy-4-methyl-2-oxoglutarate aldolase